jgi:hypothetical protein
MHATLKAVVTMANRALCLLATTCMFMSSTHAADFFLQGAGTVSCGKYLEGRGLQSAQVNNMFEQWLHGYLSGVNVTRANTNRSELRKLPDGASILAFIDKFCREAPLKDVWLGAETLLLELPRFPHPK